MPFIVSTLLTLFLFFIDEGYYNFNWMSKAGNWMAFLIYVSLFFAAELIVINYLFRNRSNTILTISKYALGALLGFIFAFLVFKGWSIMV